MPKIECFAVPGIECWFWSNDHQPPHFHAKRQGEWELKVYFLLATDAMFELEWGHPPKAKLRREIAKAVSANRDALLHEWETKVNQ